MSDYYRKLFADPIEATRGQGGDGKRLWLVADLIARNKPEWVEQLIACRDDLVEEANLLAKLLRECETDESWPANPRHRRVLLDWLKNGVPLGRTAEQMIMASRR